MVVPRWCYDEVLKLQSYLSTDLTRKLLVYDLEDLCLYMPIEKTTCIQLVKQ
jgi:hypothetical protein